MRDVPPSPVADDGPAFGTYAGRFEDSNLGLADRGVGWLGRLIAEKRWQWFAAFDDAVAVGGAVVDTGLVGTAFLWVVDRETGALLADADLVMPSPLVTVATRPASGVVARVDLPRRRLRITRTDEAVAVDARFAGVDVALAASTRDRTAVSAVCPVPGRDRGVNVTQKDTCIPFDGHVAADRRHAFDGVGALDYSHGLLARETTWRWAIGSCRTAAGLPVGFNLVSGFNDGLENAVWVDGDPEAVGTATVEADGDVRHVRTDCGTVDATLSVEAVREEDLDVGVIASQYVQPLGAWSGTVAGHRIEGVGVAERHRARW
jgi:hypothetical protein